jgi:CheY-like chemotaxis protein
LLTFARGGAPVKKATDLNRFIEESARFITRGSKSGCTFEFAGDLWAAEVDSGQIHQAISNIIINASQAMPDGGTIKIKTENAVIGADTTLPLSAGPYIRIVIEDQGIGISGKHLSKIFDPYFTTKQKGSGLGLATTYSIIKRHDGHITAHSRRDEGTVFTIYLPACAETCEAVETKGTEHYGSGRILIMDDHEQILIMLGIMLNQMGYGTVSATDGRQAIELYRRAYQSGEPFDLVILDLTVPGGMGGAKAIQELIKIDPGAKAIVSSGYSNDPVMADYKDYGFRGVVPKPYTKNQLAEVLNGIFLHQKNK